MTYLALLRGINVGGNNKVEMGRLRACFEAIGLQQVRTYINTGNVIFATDEPDELPARLEHAIADEFSLELPVLVRDIDEVRAVEAAIPSDWVNDSTMKCDVMFLWEDIDNPSILDQLPLRDGIDTAIYSPGAVIWQVDRPDLTRSGMARIVGTKLYRSMTVRNANTVRKLATLMNA